MLRIVLITFAAKWVLLNALPVNLEPNDACVTPGRGHGRCVLVGNCQFVKNVLKNAKTIEDQQYMDQLMCGKHPSSGKTLVCCPAFQNVEGCGRLTLEDHITGGIETDPDEFPWTALLVYTSRKVQYFRCGGTLINDRYVLTAAHCVTGLRILKLHAVRLGEWDLSTRQDCKIAAHGKHCNKFPHLDIVVDKVVVHQGYSSDRKFSPHDIALLKLSTPAPNMDSIAPICLLTAEMDEEMDVESESFDVTGWGATGEGEPRSIRKLKVTLPGQDMDVCRSAYAVSNVTLTENQLCVGGIEGKDSCRGDSGGPLMTIIDNRWQLVGLVSMGPRKCGIEGMPAIYTRMGKYLDWVAAMIEQETRYDGSV